MYPCFQGYMRFVSLLFPLIRPRKVIHIRQIHPLYSCYIFFNSVRIIVLPLSCSSGAGRFLGICFIIASSISVASLCCSISSLLKAFTTSFHVDLSLLFLHFSSICTHSSLSSSLLPLLRQSRLIPSTLSSSSNSHPNLVKSKELFNFTLIFSATLIESLRFGGSLTKINSSINF